MFFKVSRVTLLQHPLSPFGKDRILVCRISRPRFGSRLLDGQNLLDSRTSLVHFSIMRLYPEVFNFGTNLAHAKPPHPLSLQIVGPTLAPALGKGRIRFRQQALGILIGIPERRKETPSQGFCQSFRLLRFGQFLFLALSKLPATAILAPRQSCDSCLGSLTGFKAIDGNGLLELDPLLVLQVDRSVLT